MITDEESAASTADQLIELLQGQVLRQLADLLNRGRLLEYLQGDGGLIFGPRSSPSTAPQPNWIP